MLLSQALKLALLPTALSGLALMGINAAAPEDPLPPQNAGYQVWWEDNDTGDLELIGLGDTVVVTNNGPGNLHVTYRDMNGGLLGRETLAEGQIGSTAVTEDMRGESVGSGDETKDVDATCISDCLPLGSLVQTLCGTVRVEELERVAAQGLATRDGEGGVEVAGVNQATSNHLVELSMAGESLRVTRGHEFLTSDGDWVEARDLEAGAKIMARSAGSDAARAIVLDSVRVVELATPVAVYDVVLSSPGDMLVGAIGAVTRGTVEQRTSSWVAAVSN